MVYTVFLALLLWTKYQCHDRASDVQHRRNLSKGLVIIIAEQLHLDNYNTHG
jgi:hypothetical protein